MAKDSSLDDSGDIRRKAFIRLVVAGVVTAAALAALWWLDKGGEPAKKAPGKPPSPIVTAPAQSPAAPLPAEDAASSEATEKLAATTPPPPPVVDAQPAQTGSAAPPVKPAAPTVAKQAPAASVKPVQATSAPAQTTAATQPVQATGPAPQGVTPAHSPTGGFIVQLGVFADPVNARELVERLNKIGVKARMETRVQVGPFRNREEAEKARAEIARLGVKGVVATK